MGSGVTGRLTVLARAAVRLLSGCATYVLAWGVHACVCDDQSWRNKLNLRINFRKTLVL